MGRKNFKRSPVRTNAEVKKVIDEILDYNNIHVLEKVLTTANRVFSKGTTGTYIPFVVTNIAIDQFSGAAQTQMKYAPIYDQIKLLREYFNDDDSNVGKFFKEYLMLGGERHSLVNWMDMTPNEFSARIAKEQSRLEGSRGS